jgi:aspartate/methionine/tyrosine aminotransferase
MISKRANRWTEDDAYLVRAHFTCETDPFDSAENPDGYVNFGTAQNHLVFDTIAPLLRESVEIVERDTHYNELHGAKYFREAIVDFLQNWAGRSLEPDSIVIAVGASAILEILSFALCDPGDTILVPTPYYPGFDHDLAFRSDAVLEPIHLRGPEFRLSITDIEEAYTRVTSRGARVAALLISSPNNPLGHIYDEELTRQMVDLADRLGIHLILDEIYAESILPRMEHYSGLRIRNPRLHIVYGFAKDFGLSGYKVGILHSEDPEVLKAARILSYFHTVPVMIQRTLTGLLRSERLEEFFVTMRSRLDTSYRATTAVLAGQGIHHVPVQGGIVLWLDLRPHLRSITFEAEQGLWADIFNECRVNISPGNAFHCSEPGWFRLCFTVPDDHRVEGLRRFGEHIKKR